MTPKVVATIEARMGSSRLPGKVLLEAAGKPILLHMVERLRHSRYIDELVVATTVESRDEAIADMCERHGIDYFRGSEDNVLERVVTAGKHYDAEICALFTGDCPLVDPLVVDQMICTFLSSRKYVELVTNGEVRSYAHGFDLHVMTCETLAGSLKQATSAEYQEHVGWYVRRHPEKFRRQDVIAPPGLSFPYLKIALDEQKDYERIREIFDTLYPNDPFFTASDIMEFAHERGWLSA